MHEGSSPAILPRTLSYHARVFYRQAAELTSRLSDDLYRIYRNLELPLMLVPVQIGPVGIGLDGVACVREYIVQNGTWLASLKILRAGLYMPGACNAVVRITR
jgi:hypothetical protein